MATAEQINFVTQLSNTLNVIGKKLNHSYRWTFGLSIFLLVLSIGLIKTEDEISFQWINIKLNAPFLLITLSFLLIIFQ